LAAKIATLGTGRLTAKAQLSGRVSNSVCTTPISSPASGAKKIVDDSGRANSSSGSAPRILL
jgi:hypothetical protein